MSNARVSSPQLPLTREQRKKLALVVNELFHDLEGKSYELHHPEIFQDEVRRWRRVAAHLLSRPEHRLRVLDVGSGTGFVPCLLLPFLRAEDELVCSDLSGAMLDVCRKALRTAGAHCSTQFVKLDGGPIDVPGSSFDLITMNSVLHHVPDTGHFLADLDQLLAEGGYLIIGHEPNLRFAENPVLRMMHRLFELRLLVRTLDYLHLGQAIRSLRMGARRLLSSSSSRELAGTGSTHEQVLDQLNRSLMNRGLTNRRLTMNEVWTITDIHDPCGSGRLEPGLGFDVDTLLERFLPGYRVVLFESYRHLSFFTDRSLFTRGLSACLSRLFPRDGATFFAALQKGHITPGQRSVNGT